MIAALFVQRNGCYFGLPNVDPWDATRDARLYRGPHPVVAHPPCERWGRYAADAIGAKRWNRPRKIVGDDGGCFAHALWSVRSFGGVLEHPCDSKAWRAHGLLTPPRRGGWVNAGDGVGWTCCVEQGHFGHRARKATWLYAVGCELPSLSWGPSSATAYACCPPNTHAQRAAGYCEVLSRRERAATPPLFRDLLIRIASSATGDTFAEACAEAHDDLSVRWIEARMAVA